MNRKGHRRKRLWNKLNCYAGMFLGRLEENHEKYQSGCCVSNLAERLQLTACACQHTRLWIVFF